MKISYNWLKEYINTDKSPQEIAEILTNTGLEVEGLEEIETIKGGLKGLVIGKVLEKEKHPNADKLSLTKVDVGEGKVLPIICGAPNVAAGQTVVVATVGTILYSTEGEPFKIKKSKIRGEVSEGMICAEDEIGLGNSHDGIIVIDEDVKPGTPAKEYFQIESDWVFEIGLTPNRSDATSHYGVARDLAAYLNQFSPTKAHKPDVSKFAIDNTDLTIQVEVENTEACPRYSAITVSNIQVKESPEWLQNRLRSIGLSPINNVVDITNFVLHEIGQPLHAFDASKIKGNKVIVRTPEKDTKFITLDEKERQLHENDLMICNESDEMCIAGVFGGLTSGVSNNTTSVFLESAYFNPVYIRKTAKRHGLNTDASFRYERGADPNITIYALKRAALLIKEIAGGEISSEIIDVYPNPIADTTIDFNLSYLYKIAGTTIPEETIEKILQGLEIVINSKSGDTWNISIPAYRVDVTRPIDLVEEILRIYGYNKIELPEKLNTSITYKQSPDKDKIRNTIGDFLSANGFYETLTNSLTKRDYYPEDNHVVEILNPLSRELNVMRKEMIFTTLETILHNINNGNKNVKVYDFGKVYAKYNTYEEQEKLALAVTGKWFNESWLTPDDKSTVFHLKGITEALFQKLGLNKLKVKTTEVFDNYLATGIEVTFNKHKIAKTGIIHPQLNKQFDIDQEVFYSEINLDKLYELTQLTKTVYTPVVKFPAVRRDLALLLDKPINYAQIVKEVKQLNIQDLKEINLFDVYEGKNLPEGKKSYGISFIFQNKEKTLTDKQVDIFMNKIIERLTQKLKAELR
ncbi:MAG TPA: phenylalanine--tRNA ligase subunit beta [Flavobacteriales bacterium]|nr:phenylalanine--tRNA ligase subunit beta [Flavobacteriales bacterium]|tara:strand:- start:87209 stop:89620 length:2412 start_codon:yes stop_codon:yes gene_type:complete